MAVVADTHTLIWYLGGSNRLSETAIAALDQAIQADDPLYIASISWVEITYLAEKMRLPDAAYEQLYQALTEPNAVFKLCP